MSLICRKVKKLLTFENSIWVKKLQIRPFKKCVPATEEVIFFFKQKVAHKAVV